MSTTGVPTPIQPAQSTPGQPGAQQPWWKRALQGAGQGVQAQQGQQGRPQPGGGGGIPSSMPQKNNPYGSLAAAGVGAARGLMRPPVNNGPRMGGPQIQQAQGAAPNMNTPPPAMPARPNPGAQGAAPIGGPGITQPVPPPTPPVGSTPPIPGAQSNMSPSPAGQPGMPPVQSDMMSAPMDQSGGMAGGRVVSKPTVALLGEKGPEAVVPMNSNKDNKVRPAALMGRRSYGE